MATYRIQQEDGSFLLIEMGDYLLLEYERTAREYDVTFPERDIDVTFPERAIDVTYPERDIDVTFSTGG